MHFSEEKTGCKRKSMRKRTLGIAECGEAPKEALGYVPGGKDKRQ